MRNELHNFIKEIANGDRSKYNNFRIGEDRLLVEFAQFLGFKRWHSPILRPDNDPKWMPFKWSMDQGSCVVSDIRVMSFPSLYAHSLKEIADPSVCFPNGMNVRDLLSTLKNMRSSYKQGKGEMYCEYQMIAKFLMNILYSVICRHGSAIGIGAHHINTKAREFMTDAVKKISETCVVLYAYCDFIVYVGDQVEVPGVHHERFNSVVFSKHGNFYGITYGDRLNTYLLPHVKFRMSEWNELIGSGSYEERYARAQRMYQRRIDNIKNDLFRYIAITKEDIERQYEIDSECDSL